MLLPASRTMTTALEVRRLFQTALIDYGVASTDALKATPVMMAQSALETGHWNSMWCWNFGNVRPGSHWTGDICQFRCNEFIGGKVVWFEAPAPGAPGYGDPNHGSSFRAFLTSLQGARQYAQFVQQRYPEAFAAALKGDAPAFVHGLKIHGYFTAPEAAYMLGVTRLLTEFEKLGTADIYAIPTLDWSGLQSLSAHPNRTDDIQSALNKFIAAHPGSGTPAPLVVDGAIGDKTRAALSWAEGVLGATDIQGTLAGIGVA